MNRHYDSLRANIADGGCVVIVKPNQLWRIGRTAAVHFALAHEPMLRPLLPKRPVCAPPSPPHVPDWGFSPHCTDHMSCLLPRRYPMGTDRISKAAERISPRIRRTAHHYVKLHTRAGARSYRSVVTPWCPVAQHFLRQVVVCYTEKATKAWHLQEHQQQWHNQNHQPNHAATKEPMNKTKTYTPVI